MLLIDDMYRAWMTVMFDDYFLPYQMPPISRWYFLDDRRNIKGQGYF